MDKAQQYFLNDSIKSIALLYEADLLYSLTSYFYFQGNIDI